MQLMLRELKTARRFLGKAQMLIAQVSALFFDEGDPGTSARLNDIATRLTDEIKSVEKRIKSL